MTVTPTLAERPRGVDGGRASGESRRRRAEAIRRIVAATRQAQGLPPTVEDNAVLDLVAAHLERQAVPDEAA